MKTKLNFEDKTTKELLSKLDFEYFLKQNIEIEKYSSVKIDELYSSYRLHKKELRTKSIENKKQLFFYVEGQVRKMFDGGLLPALFELDGGRKHTIFDFPPIGENWAYFDFWKKSYNRKLTKERIWNYTTRVGSILAIILTLLKLYELIMIS